MRRRVAAASILLLVLLLPALSLAQTSSPPAGPHAPVNNMVSGWVWPLIIFNSVDAEYERVISPDLGGINIRAHAEYAWLALFDIGGVGAGGHWVYYVPFDLGMNDPHVLSGAPSGFLIAPGMDVTYWRGRFFPGGYRATVSGVTIEPNVYAGYRFIYDNFFVEPRGGLGWGFFGARYRDANGKYEYRDRGHNLDLDLNLRVGLAW